MQVTKGLLGFMLALGLSAGAAVAQGDGDGDGDGCPTLGCELLEDPEVGAKHYFGHQIPAPDKHCRGAEGHGTCHAAPVEGDCETHPTCIANFVMVDEAVSRGDWSRLAKLAMDNDGIEIADRGLIVRASCNRASFGTVPLPPNVISQVKRQIASLEGRGYWVKGRASVRSASAGMQHRFRGWAASV